MSLDRTNACSMNCPGKPHQSHSRFLAQSQVPGAHALDLGDLVQVTIRAEDAQQAVFEHHARVD